MGIQPTKDVGSVAAEAAKTKETADRLANGDYPADADHVRVLAGIVKQLADQVERLASTGVLGTTPLDRELDLEEDRTPERAPAEPLDDRTADQPPR
jgi:hypothetical protein